MGFDAILLVHHCIGLLVGALVGIRQMVATGAWVVVEVGRIGLALLPVPAGREG